MAVVHESHRVAIGADGPRRFLRGSRVPSVQTELKRRQLRHEGWVVMPVPHWEWECLPSDSERRSYLSSLLSSSLRESVTGLMG